MKFPCNALWQLEFSFFLFIDKRADKVWNNRFNPISLKSCSITTLYWISMYQIKHWKNHVELMSRWFQIVKSSNHHRSIHIFFKYIELKSKGEMKLTEKPVDQLKRSQSVPNLDAPEKVPAGNITSQLRAKYNRYRFSHA